MIDAIIISIILVAVFLVIRFLVKEKAKGRYCMGCSSAGSCTKACCSSETFKET